MKLDEQTLKILARIYESQDGKDFIDYIITLKNKNYEDWKQAGGDVLRGKAVCYDEIIALLQNASTRLLIQSKKDQEWL